MFPTYFSQRILSSNKTSEEAHCIEPGGKGLRELSGLSLENTVLYVGCVGGSKESVSCFSVWSGPGVWLVPYGIFILRKWTNYVISLGNQSPSIALQVLQTTAEKTYSGRKQEWHHHLYKSSLEESMLRNTSVRGYVQIFAFFPFCVFHSLAFYASKRAMAYENTSVMTHRSQCGGLVLKDEGGLCSSLQSNAFNLNRF